jgi:Protein of unknown function (DUF4199)
MEEKETPSLFQHALKWGLIVGGISIALTIVSYAVDYSMLANWKFGIFVLVMMIGLVIYAGINYRNEIGGLLPYGKAFQHGFILMAICGLISTLFTAILYTVIDPELPAKLTDAAMENAQKMMESFGMPADQMDQALEDARKRTENQFSVSGLAMGYGIGLIIYAVLAAITSIFVKKNPPDEVI